MKSNNDIRNEWVWLKEPSWASYAREKSERARSRTPKGRELSPEDYRSGSMPYRQVPIVSIQ